MSTGSRCARQPMRPIIATRALAARKCSQRAASAVICLVTMVLWARPVSAAGNDTPTAACAAASAFTPGVAVDVKAFGAHGNGIDDDSDAIARAIASLDNGGTVVFPPGTYVHGNVLAVHKANIVLLGRQAELHAGNPDRAAILLAGESSAIRGFTITSAPANARGERLEQSGVVVSGAGNVVAGNTVIGFKSAGIIVVGARNYVIGCNRVSDTKADGIHATRGATHGFVAGNSVFNSGDDGIAMVSYSSAGQTSAITIEENDVEHIRWGRGISVVGSRDATIRHNHIKSVAMAAGILVSREEFWHTPGARNVIIDDNELVDIQRTLAPLDGGQRTGHAAIELNSDSDDPALAVSDVHVLGNRIDGAAYDGIRLLGNVCNVTISGNRLHGIDGRGIAVKDGCTRRILRCADNLIDGMSARCD
jgi:polygalacturonase